MGKGTKSKARKARCMRCGEKPAKVLSHAGCYGGERVFCSSPCAVQYAVAMARGHGLRWCAFHDDWHVPGERDGCMNPEKEGEGDGQLPLFVSE